METTSNRKILIVAYVFPPIAYVGTYRTLRFCRYLPENGWEPHVLTINEADDLDNDYKLLSRLPDVVKIHRTKTVDFWRMWYSKKNAPRQTTIKNKSAKSRTQQSANLNSKNKKSILSSIKNFIWSLVTTPDHMVFWVPFAVTKGIKILLRGKFEVIYTSSPPHSEHLIGYILSILFRKRWIADFRDPMLDSSGYSPSKISYRIDRFLEKLIVKNAHKVMIISNNYLDKIKARYPWAEKKFVVLPNGYDPDLYSKANRESFDKFTILYSGSFYAKRKPDFFLKGFGQWLDYRPELKEKVQVFFYGLESPKAKQIVKEMDLESVVHFPGLLSQDELIPKQKGADLLLLIIGFDQESRGTLTSKIFEYMACQRSILAIIPDGDAANILQNYDKLYRVGCENVTVLTKALDKAYARYLENGEKEEDIPGDVSCSKNPFNARSQTKRLSFLFSND